MFFLDGCLDAIGVTFVKIGDETVSFHFGHDLEPILDKIERGQKRYCNNFGGNMRENFGS